MYTVVKIFFLCEMDLLCWGSGQLGQSGHGRPEDIRPEEACLLDFTLDRLGRVKLLACGSSHSIVVTGTVFCQCDENVNTVY